MNKTFGQRVREERKRLKLTQLELAKQVGMSQGNLSDIENDAVPTSTYTPALARAFKVNAHWLATGIGNRDGSDDSAFLSRKSEPSTHNKTVTKAIFDLLKELDKGDLSPDMQSLLTAEIEAKVKIIRKSQAARKKDPE